MLRLNDLQWAAFYRKFRDQTGVDFNLYKQPQLQRQIVLIAEQRHLTTFHQLQSLFLGDKKEQQWFLDKLAINVTEVFRNPELWGDLQRILKNDLLSSGGAVQAWSAGCSTGAEAYSLAAILDRHAPGRSHRIVCTDIDHSALNRAKKGELMKMEARTIPREYGSYFDITDDGANVAEKLKRSLTFHQHNLLADNFGSGYDLIICRNVVIYFVDEAKDDIFRRFYTALKPGGYLFLGSSERIYNTKAIGFECPKPYFYRKPSEEKEWRNAS